MLNKVKLALLITENDFDTELTDLIAAALIDLGFAGVEGDTVIAESTDSIVIRAIISYCAYHFELVHGSLDRSEAFKKSYDEQKAQLSMATNYTVWADSDE